MTEKIEKIEAIVCGSKGIHPKELKKKTRVGNIKETRQVIMYLTHEAYPNMTWASIGSYFKLDRATAMHAHKTISNLTDTDKHLAEEVLGYKNKINAIKLEKIIDNNISNINILEAEYLIIKNKVLELETTIKALKREYQSLGFNIITEINGED